MTTGLDANHTTSIMTWKDASSSTPNTYEEAYKSEIVMMKSSRSNLKTLMFVSLGIQIFCVIWSIFVK